MKLLNLFYLQQCTQLFNYNIQFKLANNHQKMKLKNIEPLRAYERAIKLGLNPDNYKTEKMREETINLMDNVKKKDRSNLKLQQWERKQYYKTDATFQLFNCPDEIQRIHMNNLSVQQFIERYQKTSTPVIIKGCSNQWEISQKWNHSYFVNNFSNSKFKVGEDDDGYKIRVHFHNYIQYLLYNQDDSPLYLFQSALQEKAQTKKILQNYKVPPYFQDDLFKLAGQQKRPPYRWFIMGPERSGTTLHTDPLYTSAWNSSLCGHKRWVVFGSSMPKSIVKGKQFRVKFPVYKDDEAINYFVQILPRIIEKYTRQELQIRQFIQYPGETVFIPGGLWHAVINLDDTIAVTQNVMTKYCFDNVWRSTRSQRRKFAQYFLNKLQKDDSQLYARAIDLNAKDRYTMGQKYPEQEVSLSFTPSSSSSSSSSSSENSSSDKQESFSIQKKKNKCGNRMNMIQRSFKNSSRSSSSSSKRSRDKNKRTIFSEQKRIKTQPKIKPSTSSASDS